MRELIKIDDLHFSYGNKTIFNHFTMHIEEGQFIAISGSNKCGKTTLIKLMAGLLPSKENIVLGYSYINNKRIQDSAKEIGVVLSDLETQFLFEDAYQELVFPLENLNYKPEEIEQRILEVSKLLKIEPILDKKIEELTISEKKKLCLALALLHHPKVLLLDQPFSMLSKADKTYLIEVLKTINKKEKTTIVLATNQLEDTIKADYLYILNNGKIVIEGSPLVVMTEDKLLNRLGLELPFMVDLSLKLKFYDLLDEIIIDMDRMVNELWK